MNYSELRTKKVTAYTLYLNEGMVDAFKRFMVLWMNVRMPVPKGDIGLTTSQYGNFQNLRHFGIIEQAEKGSGWQPTELGMAFYTGKAGVLEPAGMMDGETLDDRHPAWRTHGEGRNLRMIGETGRREYKKREEYQNEVAATPYTGQPATGIGQDTLFRVPFTE